MNFKTKAEKLVVKYGINATDIAWMKQTEHVIKAERWRKINNYIQDRK